MAWRQGRRPEGDPKGYVLRLGTFRAQDRLGFHMKLGAAHETWAKVGRRIIVAPHPRYAPSPTGRARTGPADRVGGDRRTTSCRLVHGREHPHASGALPPH